MYYPTQNDIRALLFRNKEMYVRLLLLNDKFQIVYEMNYEYISGDISINVDSDIRNVLSMSLFAKDKSISFAEDRKLWINKFVRVMVGVKVPIEQDILWYDKGIFVMTDYTYNASTRLLNISCSDLVCYLNGDVSGNLEGLKTEIKEEEKITIRQAIIDTFTGLTKFTKYYVDDMPKLIPYDLEFSSSDSVWTILTTLRDLYSGYEMFFDIDGTFICRQISVKESDPVVLDDDVLQKIYVSETDTGDIKSMRNVSKVFGKCLDTDYFTTDCSYDSKNNVYSATFTGVAINDDGTLPTSAKFAFKIPETNTTKGTQLKIYNKKDDSSSSSLVGTYDIVDSAENPVEANLFVKDSSFIFRYRRANMLVMGQYQIMAVNKLRNTEPTDEEKANDKKVHECDFITYTISPDSPFAIERIGEYMKVYSGTDYEKIQAIDDCITRAEYETWLSAKIAYTISLEMIYIPWLQGNEKIRFTMASTGETKDWVVQSISSNLNTGTMTVSLTEFAPLYNFDIVN